jgi:cystathionine beta-lyase/cystathionine gamma-synthase
MLMNEPEHKGFNTNAVHAGELKDPRFGNVITPIFENSTFLGPNETADAYVDITNKKPFLYTRWGNPTIQSFEEKYAVLEGYSRSLAFSSGMSAISAAIMSIATSGSKILAVNGLYGQTYIFLSKTLKRMGITTEFLDLDAMNSLSSIDKNIAMVYIETILNPTLGVSDIEHISALCHEIGIPLVVDSTFSTPYNVKPVIFGADITLHSATKYIGGHSDIIMGVAGISDSLYDGMTTMRKNFGFVPDPIQAFLASRGLKTLGLRMKKHNENGMNVAKFLEGEKKIVKVFYPGLESSPYNKIASKEMRGYGGMVSFEVEGGLEQARKFIKCLKIPNVAPSLGGVESLVTLPVDTSHASMTRDERVRAGINDGLIRFSCGIEDPEDIIADFQNALSCL